MTFKPDRIRKAVRFYYTELQPNVTKKRKSQFGRIRCFG